MDKIWTDLFKEAKKKLNACEISPFLTCGNNACAILGANNKIYSGVSITSNSGLNCSAEKSAITSMINDNEHQIKKMVVLNELEEIMSPSVDYFDYLLELSGETGDIEILIDLENKKVKKISELLPDWWGTFRNKKG